MLETLDVHIPIDRRIALSTGEALPSEVVGSVLFADIAGFSRMTSDLLEASGARRGAEELTRALDAIYDALIEPVRAYGGSVVSFAGDAITCVFPHDDGWAAATASAQMHTAAAGLTTRIGSELRPVVIKVGLAHGQVYRCAPGDPNIQLIDTIAGEAVLDAARAERHASAGETILAPSMRLALRGRARPDAPPISGFEPLGVLRRLAVPNPWPEVSPIAFELAAPFTLAALRRPINEGRAAYLAELRTVVAVFIRFEGLTFGADEAAVEKLDAYVRWVQSVFDSYGGSLIGVNIGDKGSYLNGAFGAPATHEDDCSRAMAAAIVLASPPASLPWIRNVGIGVCCGRQRTGSVGAPIRRTYAVLGTFGNLAARLMERAAAGQILVDSTVAEAARGSHRFESIGMVSVKGHTSTLAVFSCTGRAQAHSRGADVDSEDSLVGRLEHLSAFDGTLRPNHGSEGAALLIVGEAGIGKSRVLRALANRATTSGRSILAIVGDTIEQASAYHALRGAFTRVLDLDALPSDADAQRDYVRDRIADTPFARLAPLLDPVLPFDFPDDEFTRGLVGEARADTTRELMTSILLPKNATCPPVFLVDDAHHIDASTWALLARLRAERSDVSLVVCTRPFEDERTPREWTRLVESKSSVLLPLGPLMREELAELVARRAGAKHVDEILLDFVMERAAGHPFFTEQLLRVVLEFGHAEVVDDCCVAKASRQELDATDFPATVEGVITSRLDRLPSHDLMVLKIASVLGRTFDIETVAALHPGRVSAESITESLQGLCRRDLIVSEGDSYAFRHAIMQRVTYDLMLFSQRRDLHAHAARIIEAEHGDSAAAWYPILAHHHRQAEQLDSAVRYLDRASEHAIRQGAYDEAIRFVRSVVALDPDAARASDSNRRARRLAILGDAEMNIGSIQQSRESLEGAMAELGWPVPRSVASVVGSALVEAGRQLVHRMAPAIFVRGARDAEVRAFAARILRDLQPVYFLHNALQHMLYATLRAVNLSEAARGLGIAEQVRAEGYAAAALVASAVGAERIASAYRSRAVDTASALGEPTTLGQVWLLLALHSIGIGACERALLEASRARQLFLDGNHRRRFEVACGTMGWAAGYLGRFDEGIAAWNDVRVAAVQRGDRQSIALGYTGQAEMLIARGRDSDRADALKAVEHALDNLALEHDHMFEIHAMGLVATCHARDGHTDKAMTHFERAVSAMEGSVPLSGYSVAAYSRPADGLLDLVELGELAPSSPLLRRAVVGLERYARAFRVGKTRALRARGRYEAALGNALAAKRSINASIHVASDLGLPLDEAFARFELARRGPADAVAYASAEKALSGFDLHHELAHAAHVATRLSPR